MTLYVYKGYKPNLFLPEGLVIPPFIFPKSVEALLEGDEVPYIYIFKEEPSKGVILENELRKSIELSEVDSTNMLSSLKMILKDSRTWKLISLF